MVSVAVAATPGSRRDATQTLQTTAQFKTHTQDQGLDLFRAVCRHRSKRVFACRLRAVSVDRRWLGRGTMTYRGNQFWRYRLRGRIEDCGPSGCQRTGTFRWRGTIGSANLL